MPDNCILQFEGGSINGAKLTLTNTWLEGKISFNNEIDGTTANEQAYMWWFNDNIDLWHSFINISSGVIKYEYSSGEYLSTVAISKKLYKPIIIEGNGCVIKYEHLVSGEKWIQLYSSTDDNIVKQVVGTLNPGDNAITLSDVEGVNVGDALCLKDNTVASYNPTRNYQQGEYIFVKGINGNVITPNHKIYGTYKHEGNQIVTRFELHDVTIRNLKLEQIDTVQMAANKYTYGISIFRAKLTAENVSVIGFTHCFRAYYCINSRIQDCIFVANYKVFDGTDNYGLTISHCQDLNISGGRYEGGNHGIANGGNYEGDFAIPNRNITIQGVYANSNKFAYGIDVHGNAANYIIRDNVTNGIDVNGDNFTITNNNVSGIISLHGLTMNHIISENIVGDHIQLETIIYISDYNTNWNNWTPSTTKENLIVSGNRVKDYIMVKSETTAERYPNISNVHARIIDNVVDNGITVRLYNTKGSFDSNNAGTTEIKGNKIKIITDRYISTKSAVITDNYFYGNASSININCDLTVIMNNTFIDISTGYYFVIQNAKFLIIKNNIFKNCLSAFNIPSGASIKNLYLVIEGNDATNTKAKYLFYDESVSELIDVYCKDNLLPSDQSIYITSKVNLTYGNNRNQGRLIKPYATNINREINLDAKNGIGPMSEAPKVGVTPGFTWLDTDTNRLKIYNPIVGNQIVSYKVQPQQQRYVTNPFTGNEIVRMSHDRTTPFIFGFSKTENGEVDVYFKKNQTASGTPQFDFIPPTPTEYPYMYMESKAETNGSNQIWRFHSLDVYQDANALPITSNSNEALTVNEYRDYGTVDNLTVTLTPIPMGYYDFYKFAFTCASDSTVLTLPSGIKMPVGIQMEMMAGRRFECVIDYANCLTFNCWD